MVLCSQWRLQFPWDHDVFLSSSTQVSVPEFSSHAGEQAGAQASGSCPLLARVHTWHFSKSLRCYSPAHLFFFSWYKTTFTWLPINGDQQGDSNTVDTAGLQPKHTSAECQGAEGWAYLLILCPPAPEAPSAACCCL